MGRKNSEKPYAAKSTKSRREKNEHAGGDRAFEQAEPKPRPLLRKSSSASLLEVPTADAQQGGGPPGLPLIRRKSNSVRDLTADEAKALKAKHAEETKRKPKCSSRGSISKERTRDESGPLPPVTPKTPKTISDFQPQQSMKPRRRAREGDIDLQRQQTIDVVVKYQLGQTELKKFKACFSHIDLDQSGVIDYDEFFEFIDERKTPFSEGLFRLIDADSNGTIDYEEFVHAMVMYCMYTRDEILQFAFDTFDPGKTGAIGEKEFKRLVSLVNDGQPTFPGNFKTALAEFDRNKDGVIDFEEFKIMNKRYPMLLFPCFRLQDRMQKSTLGESHWLKLHKRLYERLKLENYRRKHNGQLPALGLVGSIRKFLGLDGRDIYQP